MIAPLVIVGVGLLSVILAAYFERRMIWPYSDPTPVSDETSASPYVAGQGTDAIALGFECLGRSHDLKGASYKIDYFFFVSPARDALAVVGSGSIASIPLQGTWLFSLGGDDAVFYSANRQSCIEYDASGKWKNQLVAEADFRRLYDAHRNWLQKIGAVLQPFGRGRELADLHRARESRVELLARRGVFRRPGPNPEYYKYTFWGAIRYGFVGIFVGLFRALKPSKP